MAFVKDIYCPKCGEQKQVISNGEPMQLCHECQATKDQQKEKRHFAGLKALTLEERIERIERWMWEHGRKPHQRDMRF